jgi:hypothetical protein
MRLKAFFAFAATAFAAWGCSGVTVHHDMDPDADLSGYRTYDWATRTKSGNEDPRVYNDVVAGQIASAVDSVLHAKGYQETDTTPDFLVGWHGAIEGKMSTNTIHNNYGYGWGWYPAGSTTTARHWDEGTLVIDIVDAETQTLVWRGSAQAELHEEGDPQRDYALIATVVTRILDKFPRKTATE